MNPPLTLSQAQSEPIWYLDRKGEIPEGKLPYFMIPIVNYHEVGGWLTVTHLCESMKFTHPQMSTFCTSLWTAVQGRLIVYLNDTYYQLAQRHPEVPRMTVRQNEVSGIGHGTDSMGLRFGCIRMIWWLESAGMKGRAGVLTEDGAADGWGSDACGSLAGIFV